MKIGILTYWQSNDNYGQILQCYALQNKLEELGHNVIIIRYDILNRKIHKSILSIIIKVIKIYPIIKKLLNLIIIKKRKKSNIIDRNFAIFRAKNLHLSEHLYKSLEELQKNPPIVDCYIAGSDQIWAQLLDLHENTVYFLNFGSSNIKKISYAASFAMDNYPNHLTALLKQNLQRLSAISVRESTGIEICKQINIEAKLVLDPTLLIPKANYVSLISKKKIITPYAYIYSLNIESANEIKWFDVQQYCKSKNLKVIATPSSGLVEGKELFENANYDYATIEGWLENIYYADIVFTTSFHGVIFSLIFHKKFIWFPIKGERGRGNNRVLDLLKILELEHHIYQEDKNNLEFDNLSTDWLKMEEKLNLLRIESIHFLTKNLQ